MPDSPTGPFHFMRRIAYDERIRLNGVSIVGSVSIKDAIARNQIGRILIWLMNMVMGHRSLRQKII